MFDDGRLKLFLKQGEQLLANARAQALSVPVGGVLAPGLFLVAEIQTQFGAADGEKRPKNRARNRMNPAKSGKPGSPKNMCEHRLGLIVRRVSHSDARANPGINQRAEVPITCAARSVFKVGSFPLGLLGNLSGRAMKSQ